MPKALTKRAASQARKNKLVKIDINPDRAWFTKRVMSDFYKMHPRMQSMVRCAAKNRGVFIAEFLRRAADGLAKTTMRKLGVLRKSKIEANRLGISVGHLLYAAWFPDNSTN